MSRASSVRLCLPEVFFHGSLLIAAMMLWTDSVVAQCSSQWSSEGWFGLDGPAVTSTLWDPDGPGPLGPRLVVAGGFTRAGSVATNGLAAYDFTTQQWSDLSAGAPVVSVCASASGSLFAAYGSSVVMRTVNAWINLGGGMNNTVNAIAVLPNGDLLAAGAFTLAGNTPANGFARWNGTTWLSTGLAVPAVGRSLAVLANGDAVVSGDFQIGGIPAQHVARWDGTFWTMLGPEANGPVRALAESSTGDIVAAGDFTAFGVLPLLHVARWSGTAWIGLGSGVNGSVLSMAALDDGAVVIGGSFTAAGNTTTSGVARWFGGAWQPVDRGTNGVVSTLCRLTGDDFVAAGSFTNAGSRMVKMVTAHASTGWQSIPPTAPTPALPSNVYSLLTLHDGSVVAGGSFTLPGGARGISRWDGSGWQPMASGVNGEVHALAEMPNGDLVAGGSFTSAGGFAAVNVARWDGFIWQPIGAGVTGSVTSLAAHGDDLVVGTAAGVSRWVNGNWVQQALPGVVALTALTDGELFAATVPASWLPFGTVWRWNGSAWQAIGSMNGGVNGGAIRAMAEGATGGLVVAGSFVTISGQLLIDIARWDGASWSAYGTGSPAGFPPVGVSVLTGNPLVVGGTFTSSPHGSASRLAKWDGTAWVSIGSPNGDVMAMSAVPNGLLVGGAFSSVAGLPATNVAELHTDCPAVAAATGPGCPGSAGMLQTTLPALWLGGTHRSRTTGFGSRSLAAVLWGFSNPNLLLSALHPLGGPGCGIYSQDDAVLLLVPFAGEAVTSLIVPNDMGLAGMTLFHQVVQFEFDANGVPIGIQSGNGLRLQIGAL